MKTTYLLLAFCILINYVSPAQQQANNNGTEKKAFQVFYEKVYLHTDKDYYSSDESIWFKAYLVNAISNIPMETSGSLYVDLISSESKVISQKMIRLDLGFGVGDFQLTDSLPGGTYKLRAYTNWMRNFGDQFLFEKEIKVFSNAVTKPSQDSITVPKHAIQFFPESGSLISETINSVAFKATDPKGKGCQASGVIVSSDNDTISWFQTSFQGMGMLAFMPIPGKKYFASGTFDQNINFKTELPSALDKGFGIKVSDYDTASFYVSIYTNQTTLDENQNLSMIINAISHGRNCFTGQVNISELTTNLKLSKKTFPVGIASITLYDTLIHAHCQRLFYISKKENIQITCSSDKAEYQPREKVTLKIKTTDPSGLPVKTFLSFAATDKSFVPPSSGNISSYLNLESEVKGKIEQPWKYFDPTNTNRYKQLDLLLLTQGWRDFVWRRLKDTPVTIKHMVEPGISLSGNVRQKFADKPIPNANITLYIPKAKKNNILTTKTNENGVYYLDGIEFYGIQKIIVNTTNEKGKNSGWILLNQPETITLPIAVFPSENDSIFGKSNFATESKNRITLLKKYKLTDTILLDEVVVTAKNFKTEKQNREHTFQGGFADYDFTIKPEDYLLSMGQFLSMKVPRAELSTEATEDGPVANDRVVFRTNGEKQPPRFVLDGVSMRRGDLLDESVIYNLPMEGIDRIMVSTNDVFAQGNGGFVISVFTNPNAFVKTKFYSLSKMLPGYYEARSFYSPVYLTLNKISEKPDLRTTIFWEPNLVTNAEGECTVSYYNTDKNTTVNYTIEGISEKGAPVVKTGNYKVK